MWDDEYTAMGDDIEEDDHNLDKDELIDEIIKAMDDYDRSEDNGWFYDDND
jgi:hypothetical protein